MNLSFGLIKHKLRQVLPVHPTTARLYFTTAKGMLKLRLTGKINNINEHEANRDLYISTRGKSHIITQLLLGRTNWEKTTNPQNNIKICEFNENGYLRLQSILLPGTLKDDLLDLRVKSRLEKSIASYRALKYDPEMHHNARGRYDFLPQDLFSLNSFASLVTSSQIRDTVFSIVGKSARLSSALVWASFPCYTFDEQIQSSQVYHMDFDFADDIKIFINLLNTSIEDGPLEYISTTHQNACKKHWTSAFLQDNDIISTYSPKQFKYFTGPEGSAFISNNRGIHRDHPPKLGHWKLGFQVAISRSNFGSETIYQKSRVSLDPSWPSYDTWISHIKRYPRMYSLLFNCVA